MSDDDGGSPASPGTRDPQDPEPPNPISVDASGLGGAADVVDERALESNLRRAAAALTRPVQRVAIEVVDDARMSILHRRHLGLDCTTDVLTFPAESHADGIDVDIAVCLDEACRQATARGHAVEHELLLYAVHGLLHCDGYDDHDADAAERMHAEEDRILRAMGIGDVFARPEAPAPTPGEPA